VYIGAAIAKARKARVGDLIALSASDGLPLSFQISRIARQQSALVDADLVLVSEPDFRALTGLPPDVTTDLVLDVRNQREVPTIAEKIRRLFPDTRPVARSELLRTYDAVFSWRSGIVILAFGGAFLAFFIFVFDKASGLSAEEKKEIGILKATGWDISDVLQVKFWEGIVISFTAFLAGIVAAYAHVFFGGALFFGPIIKGWSTLYPAFTLTPRVCAPDVLSLLFLSVVPFTIATIVPAWRASAIDPDSVMR
jgi:ABC-type lipoprotein release transport system permease subunit